MPRGRTAKPGLVQGRARGPGFDLPRGGPVGDQVTQAPWLQGKVDQREHCCLRQGPSPGCKAQDSRLRVSSVDV